MPSTPGAASTAVNVTATPQNSVLFSTQPGDYFCGSLEQIDPRADEELLMWEKRGGEWKKTAESLKRHTSDDGRPELVKQVRALVCGQEEAEE